MFERQIFPLMQLCDQMKNMNSGTTKISKIHHSLCLMLNLWNSICFWSIVFPTIPSCQWNVRFPPHSYVCVCASKTKSIVSIFYDKLVLILSKQRNKNEEETQPKTAAEVNRILLCSSFSYFFFVVNCCTRPFKCRLVELNCLGDFARFVNYSIMNFWLTKSRFIFPFFPILFAH